MSEGMSGISSDRAMRRSREGMLAVVKVVAVVAGEDDDDDDDICDGKEAMRRRLLRIVARSS